MDHAKLTTRTIPVPVAMSEGHVRASAPELTPDPGARRAIGRARLAAMAAGIVCLLAATYFALERRDAERLRDANIAGAHGRFSQAVDASRRVNRAPAQARALLVEARALRALGRRAAASRAFERAARRDPNNWEIHRDWAVVLHELGKRAAAREQMSRALSLNPRMTLPAGFVRARRR